MASLTAIAWVNAWEELNDPRVYRVKPTVSGTGDCLSWANACTLQTALSFSRSGDEIWVISGTHKPTSENNRNATFQLKDGVAVYGGFAGNETALEQRDPAANVAILSGDIGIAGNNSDNSYHVVKGASDATLDGFTVTAGNANGAAAPDIYGGGMYNSDISGLTVANVTFRDNDASQDGGGMYNTASSLTVTSLTFDNNRATYGAGMYNNANSNTAVTNVTFSGNTAYQYGGGMFNWASSPTLTNVTFSGNSATAALGGGMYSRKNSSPTLKNVIIANSTSGGDCILYSDSTLNGNSANNLIQSTGASACGLSDGDINGNIIGVDPLLGALDNYSGATQTFPLLPGSPAIDAGDDTVSICDGNPTDNFDQRGVTRPQGAHCDIGAFESQGFTLGSPSGTPQSAVINAPFATPLGLTVTSSHSEPVNGGLVTLTAPSTGASLATTAYSLTIASGIVSQSVTANGTPGSYNVTASAAGAASVDFNLTNITPIVYAIPDGATSGSCDSWATACELRYALSSSTSGQEIWAKAGTYKPTASTTDRAATFQLKDGVAVYGGFAGTETARDQRGLAANVTILSGDIDNNDINTDGNNINETYADIRGNNSYHVVRGASGATLDGFIVTGGNANGSYPDTYGGGMFNWPDSNPTITNVTFSGNSAQSGGGMSNNWYSSPTLTNVTFSGNSATYGGGMYNDNSSPTLTNVTFSGNTATTAGGVGGMSSGGPGSSPTLKNVIIANSIGSGDCAGSLNAASANNLIESTGSYACNLSNDTNGNIIGSDPLLGALGNYGGFTPTLPLLPGSPAINAGNDTVSICDSNSTDNFDQRGVTRPQGAHCDIGAFESEVYTLTYTAGTGGTLTGTSPQTVNHGADGTEVTAIADASYRFVSWSDGVLTASRTDTNVTGDITVTANFAINTYTLTYTAGANGSITGTSPQTVNHGADGTEVTAVPDTNYHFVSWSDGVLTASRTDTNVTDDITVTASFAADNQSPTDISLSVASVNENQPIDTPVGTLTTTDPDAGDTFIYSLTCDTPGADDTSFAIAGDTLTTAAVFDYETKNSYNICVRVTDSGSLFFDKNFTITVNNVIEMVSVIIRSAGTYDGWLLESTETSGVGGTLDSTATTFHLGDNAQGKQYRSILSFNTAALPDNAVITKVTLKIRKQGLVGTDPFTILGGLKVDMRKPYFGTALGLAVHDFQAAAGKTAVATFNATPVSGWYSALLNATGRNYVNKTGTTQFRLYFRTDDNNDNGADYMKFFSGNYATVTARPTLIIEYYVP